jgi:hypothetical protein
LPIFFTLDYHIIKKNFKYTVFAIFEILFVPFVVITSLLKAFYDILILRKKEVKFTITKKIINNDKKPIFIKKIIKNIIFLLIMLGGLLSLIITMHLYYLQPLLLLLLFPLSNIVLSIVSI